MEVDKSNFRGVILDSIKQFDVNLDFFNQLELKRRSFKKILLCGMGGSALIGDILSYFQKNNFAPLLLKLPIYIHRSYTLPPEADDDTLIICISYSGQTEETLSAYQKAKENDLEIAAITCGGKLAELCQQNKNPWVKIPTALQPRLSLGYQLAALVKIFMAYGLLPSSADDEFIGLSKKIIPLQLENETKTFCQKLNRKTPIIYSSDNNQALARIWKIKFNENTKIPAFWNYFPELNHNEMVGWNNIFGTFHFLFIQDSDDMIRIQKRMELTAQLLKQRGLEVDFIKLVGANPLEKLFWGITLGDWISYHLAIFYGVDPNPVDMVEEFKQKLNE